MSKFQKKRGKSSPEVSTASLPDIIFMLLFFFMVVTTMRDTELMIDVKTPDATELTKLEKKSLVNYIYIGKPKLKFQETYGTNPRIQLGDKFASEKDIPLFLQQHKAKIPEVQRGGIKTSLRIDENVKMGVVADVKTALRKSGQLLVNYSAKRRAEK